MTNNQLPKSLRIGVLNLFGYCFLYLVLFSQAFADKGMIPVSMPNVSIYESGQKAIIGWNGKKEIMILTVDAYADSSSKILEILPLPSEPKVNKGNWKSFKAVQRLIKKHTPQSEIRSKGLAESVRAETEGGVEIIFHKNIEQHNLTCVKALNYEEFMNWAYKFLKSEGIESISGKPVPFPYKLAPLIYDYLNQNISYFVFDIVELEKERTSICPLIYEFNTSFLFFPLAISRLANGDTKIQLFLVTPQIPWSEALTPFKIGKYMPSHRFGSTSSIIFQVNREELDTVEPSLNKLFKKDKPWFTALEYEGPMGDLRNDLKLTTFCNIIEYKQSLGDSR